MKLIKLLIPALLVIGCATVTPQQLINARAAYQQASEGPAAKLAPAELHIAQVALTKAEQSFKANSDSFRTLDLAYVAQRKAELASVIGTMAVSKASKDNSNADYNSKQAEISEQAVQDLRNSEKRAADAESDAATELANRNLRDSERRTDAALADVAKLKESEKRTTAAMAALAKLAAVKEDERGLVVTLSGSVLFRSNESALLPAAKTKLDDVGSALRTVSERHLLIEGHTDSYGTPSYNQVLSQRRADTVRDYLVHGGFPAERIRASGMGEGNPIGDNSSAEGRANNRRVEIIIERDSHASNQ